MSILSDLVNTIKTLNIPIETGYFSDKPPSEYIVLTPLIDSFELYADNGPLNQVEELRISLFTKNNYINLKNQLARILLGAGFIITDRRYLGFEDDTKYHHYVIDVMKEYEMEGI